jgi:hypothetical protein
MRYRFGEAKVWSVVRVPSVEDEDNRHLHRELIAVDAMRVPERAAGYMFWVNG